MTFFFSSSFFLSSSSNSAAASAAATATATNDGGEIISYAPPRNWTSPPAAVRVVDGDTVVAAGIVVRLLGMDAPEDGQLCGRGRRRRGRAAEEQASLSSFFSLSLLSRWLRYTTGKNHANDSSSSSSSSSKNSYDCGAEATRALRGLVVGRRLRCERSGTDRYGRALARCYVVDGTRKKSLFSSFFSFFSAPFREGAQADPIDIGEWMLRRGHAVSYLGATKLYLEAESAAKREQRGIWAGEFELPEVWREKRRREREAKAAEKKKMLQQQQKKKKGAKKATAAKGSSSRKKKKKRSKTN